MRAVPTICVIAILMLASCVQEQKTPRLQDQLDDAMRQHLISKLDHEMRANQQFVRIHAAEALIAHGEADRVAKFMAAETETTAPMYRITVWRVMARAAAKEQERRAYVERIRRAVLDLNGPDRGHAAESLGKLGEAIPADREALLQWVATLNDADAAFPRWLVVLSSSEDQREEAEENLAKLLDSSDGIARLRAAFALGRLNDLSPASLQHLRRRLPAESADSPSRAYVIAAILLHMPRESSEYSGLKQQLLAYVDKGKPNEQLLAGTVIGLRGTIDDLPALSKMLNSPEADARIGAAMGSLYLLKR